MKQVKIKNIILISMVLVCIYLSSNVWLKLPDLFKRNTESDEGYIPNGQIESKILNVIRPVKNVINYNEYYTITYSDEQDMWGMAVVVMNDAFKSFDKNSINKSAAFPSQYLKFDFNTDIPVEIFTGNFKIENKEINNTIKGVKNVIIDLENSRAIYIYNGENTVKIESTGIDTGEIIRAVKAMNLADKSAYVFNQRIGEETIQAPVPLENTALYPVIVQSELNVFDAEATDKIAKDYFRNSYDYVRKSVEVSGNTVYVYRNKKILKISSGGVLDFYDTTAELKGSSDVYSSLVRAIDFIGKFPDFPEGIYLSDVDNIEYDGNDGFRYTFSYKIQERPILFSKVRENSALQIDVIGDSVVSYRRFIRKIDESQRGRMSEIQVLSAFDIIMGNLYAEEDEVDGGVPELKPLKKEMIKDISNIYLGYFDLSRISREQVLRVVWVVEAGDKTYIFNATTGALIEEWQ